MSDQQKTNAAAAMIENAVRLAILAGRELLGGKTEDALSTCGACLAQLYAFEAMRQKTVGLPLLTEWQNLWAHATRRQTSLYQQAMQRCSN
jgi:hypothetical protein